MAMTPDAVFVMEGCDTIEWIEMQDLLIKTLDKCIEAQRKNEEKP